jgi:hypothetical protein
MSGIHPDNIDYHPYIVCPHCGVTDYETVDYPDPLRGDGSEAEKDCGACEKPMRVQMAVTYEYRATPLPEAPHA